MVEYRASKKEEQEKALADQLKLTVLKELKADYLSIREPLSDVIQLKVKGPPEWVPKKIVVKPKKEFVPLSSVALDVLDDLVKVYSSLPYVDRDKAEAKLRLHQEDSVEKLKYSEKVAQRIIETFTMLKAWEEIQRADQIIDRTIGHPDPRERVRKFEVYEKKGLDGLEELWLLCMRELRKHNIPFYEAKRIADRTAFLEGCQDLENPYQWRDPANRRLIKRYVRELKVASEPDILEWKESQKDDYEEKNRIFLDDYRKDKEKEAQINEYLEKNETVLIDWIRRLIPETEVKQRINQHIKQEDLAEAVYEKYKELKAQGYKPYSDAKIKLTVVKEEEPKKDIWPEIQRLTTYYIALGLTDDEIIRKLRGQEPLASTHVDDDVLAGFIRTLRKQLPETKIHGPVEIKEPKK